MKYKQSATVEDVCCWVDLSPSCYYYRPSNGKRGAKASTHTFKTDGSTVANEVVVQDNIALAEAPTQGADIFTYSPTSKGAEDYAAICKEMLKRDKRK